MEVVQHRVWALRGTAQAVEGRGGHVGRPGAARGRLALKLVGSMQKRSIL